MAMFFSTDFGKDQENTEPNGKEAVVHIQSHQVSYTVCSSSSNVGSTSATNVQSSANAGDQRQSKRVRRSRVEIVEETFASIQVQVQSLRITIQKGGVGRQARFYKGGGGSECPWPTSLGGPVKGQERPLCVCEIKIKNEKISCS